MICIIFIFRCTNLLCQRSVQGVFFLLYISNEGLKNDSLRFLSVHVSISLSEDVTLILQT